MKSEGLVRVDGGYFVAGFTYAGGRVRRAAPILWRWVKPGVTTKNARRALDATGFKWKRIVREVR